MAAQRPRHDGTAQAQDVVDLTNALNELRLTVENQVINTVNAILDVANNTATLLQDRFGANAGAAGRNVAADIPVQDRIPKPRGTITNNHVMTLIQEQVTQHEMNHDLFLRTINDMTLAVCRDLAATNPQQALATWRQITAEQRNNITDEATQLVLNEHPELGFIQNCVQQWPIFGLIQTKWTQMSNNRRRQNRIAKQAVAAAAAAAAAAGGAGANQENAEA